MVRLPPGWHQRAGGWGGSMRRPGIRRINVAIIPPRPDVRRYVTRHQGPIRGDGTNQGTINGAGTCTVTVAPQGLGTVWYPVSAQIGTTTGVLDTSTVQFYLGPANLGNYIGPPSYQGGADSVGLTVNQVQPGEFITAVWTGGHPGDAATLRIVGTESFLA